MLETISAKELDWYARQDGILVIDLRSREKFRAGHIRGAVNVPSANFGENLPGRNRTLILYCDRGALSMAAARDLAERGYRVKSVVGGYEAYAGLQDASPVKCSSMLKK